MNDNFSLESPLGIFGKFFNQIILTKYLTKFLTERNLMMKDYAESEKWKSILKY